MKVSVVIPTYNRSALVVQALESVIEQTFKDREIIVVDDGSTDNTREALSKYNDLITYIYQDNSGVNAARNTALGYAEGEFIALLDSDDLWKNYKLELDVEVLEKHQDVGFVYSDFTVMREHGDDKRNGILSWYMPDTNWETLFESSEKLPKAFLEKYSDVGSSDSRVFFGDIYYSSLFHPTVLPSASLYRRSMTQSGPVFNETDPTCGDWEFFAKLSKDHGAAFIDLETAYNRSHEDEVRLTRLNASVQLRRQISLVNRVWRADKSFMEKHSHHVNSRQYDLYCHLVRACLLDGDTESAIGHIEECDALGIKALDKRLTILRTIASVPLAPAAVRLLRRLSHKVR